MTLNTSDTLKINLENLISPVGEEAIVLSLKSGELYELNEVASFIYNYLNNNESNFEAIIKVVENEYQVDAKECREDVKELIEDLITEGLIELIKS